MQHVLSYSSTLETLPLPLREGIDQLICKNAYSLSV